MNCQGVAELSGINSLFQENIEIVNLLTQYGKSSEDNIFQSPLWIRAENIERIVRCSK